MSPTITRGILRTLGPALLIVLFAGAAFGQAGGKPAPAFSLTLLDGKTLRLADLRGSPVVLLFWAPW
jgi:hypothetical protein